MERSTVDTRQLAAFARIVREGSFSRAARALDITQPTVSARIRALEEELGGPLFARQGRRVTLTPRGESFLPYAQRALSVLGEGVAAAHQTDAGRRGRVTVGTIPSLAGGFLAAAVARFRVTHPHVTLYIRSGHSDQVVEMLMDGVVGLGLLRRPLVNADVTTLLRFREPLVLVVASSHPLAWRAGVTLDDVRTLGAPLLLVQWGLPTRRLLRLLDAPPENVVEAPLETIRSLVARGAGAAFLTRTLVADDVEAGRLAEVTPADVAPMSSDSILVCRTSAGTLPRAFNGFVDAVRQEAGGFRVPDGD